MSVWREVGDRVFVRRYQFFDTNVGVVAGEDGYLVVDTRTSHRQAEEIQRELRELGDHPVRAVVNTHFHSDHVFGNHPFRPVDIWSHERCAAMVRSTGERQRKALIEDFPAMADELLEVVIDPPDRTFADRASLTVGGRTVELRYLGRGHTDNDIVVAVPDAGVLFAGDLLENGAPPYFGDAFPLDWPATVEAVLPLVAGPVVPGHGDVGDRGFAEAQLTDLRTVAELARRVDAGQLTLDDALARGPIGGEAGRTALERALRQLRGELG